MFTARIESIKKFTIGVITPKLPKC